MTRISLIYIWPIIYAGLFLPMALTHYSRPPDERLPLPRLTAAVAVTGALPLIIHYGIAPLGRGTSDPTGFITAAAHVFIAAVIVGLVGMILYYTLDPATPDTQDVQP